MKTVGRGGKFLFLFLFFSFFFFPLCFHEVSATAKSKSVRRWEKTSMVEGRIEDVTFQALEVRGNYYYFSGVPIMDERGEAAPPGALARGRMAKLYFRGGILKKIVVYTHLLIQ